MKEHIDILAKKYQIFQKNNFWAPKISGSSPK